MILVLDILRFIVGIIILSIGAYTDIRYREASDKLWIVLGFFGIIFLSSDFYFYGFDSFKVILIIIIIVVVYVLFQMDFISGGADVKALMSLSILLPLLVLDVFFLACIISLLSIPIIFFVERISLKEVFFDYKFPFLVSVLIAFIFVSLSSIFYDFNLLYSFIMFLV